MFAVFAITLLCWVSVSHSAPPACENLVQPLDQLEPRLLEGRWTLVAGIMSDQAYMEKFKLRDSAGINFVNSSDPSKLTLRRKFSFNDSCQYSQSDITLEGSGYNFDQFNISVTFLKTSCPDCALMRLDNELKKVLRVYVFSRRRAVEQNEMEEFKTLADCLSMFPPVEMDPTKELCPDQTSSDPAAETEAKTEGQKA